ncbi:hypothetical protein N9D31_03750, partial [Oligoflexaceae bacterium]|nr:hypothetical protein [Oligoflexaceae bacterium]
KLKIKIPSSLLDSWLNDEATVEKRVCVSTRVDLTPSRKLRDSMPCITIKSPHRVFKSEFESETLMHSVDLHIAADTSQISDSDAEDFLEFINRSIAGISRTLKRPLAAITHWSFVIRSDGDVINYSGDSHKSFGILWNFRSDGTMTEQKYFVLYYIAQMIASERRQAQGLLSYPGDENSAYLFECFRFWVLNRTLFDNEITAEHTERYNRLLEDDNLLFGKLSEYPQGDDLWARLHSFFEHLEAEYDSDDIAHVFSSFYNDFPNSTSELKELFKAQGFSDVDALFSTWIE